MSACPTHKTCNTQQLTLKETIFIELKGTKRIIHHKTHKMLSRSLIDSLPESQPIDEFNLQEYINLVSDEIDSSETFEL